MINRVLADLEAICDLQNDSVVVRLHGFFQTDDRIAIQEITRQLFLEKEAENQSFGTFSGKETLTLVISGFIFNILLF